MNAPTRTGPSMRRHRSEQSVSTPWEFVRAAEARFGAFAWDLAAQTENAKAPRWLGPSGIHEDAFAVDWLDLDGLCWLNPPFGDIPRWAERAAMAGSLGARIVMLVPASVGTLWFAESVHRQALVLALSPRVRFEGHAQPFPKDLLLAAYGPPCAPTFDTWRWKP